MARIGPKGRIVVPSSLRRELGLEEGVSVVMHAARGRLVIEPRSRALESLRAVVREAVPAEVSLVDELLDARRADARRDRRSHRGRPA